VLHALVILRRGVDVAVDGGGRPAGDEVETARDADGVLDIGERNIIFVPAERFIRVLAVKPAENVVERVAGQPARRGREQRGFA